MPRHYASKYQRQEQMRFVLTARDIEIIRAVNRYRYLRTGQIKRLLFADNKTQQSAQRRLKYLFHNKILGRITPLIQVGQGSAETAYFLDKAGAEILEDYDDDIYIYTKAHQVKHQFLEHALDLSEFRLNLELSLGDHPIASLKRFIGDFEIKSPTDEAIGKKIYKLYDEAIHKVSRKRYVVYPDGLIVLQGKGEYEQYQQLYFVEIDRGTLSLSKIKAKAMGYNLYLEQRIFRKFGAFSGFTVLIQTNSKQRADNIRHALNDQTEAEFILITDSKKVKPETILDEPIWLDHAGERRALIRP